MPRGNGRRVLAPKSQMPPRHGGEGRRALAPKFEMPRGHGRRVLAPKSQMPPRHGGEGRRVFATLGIKDLPEKTGRGRLLEKVIKEDLYGKPRGSGRRTLMEGIKELPPN